MQLPSKRIIFFTLVAFIFLCFGGWLIYSEIKLRTSTFAMGSPPENIRYLLLPQNIELIKMRPPALRPTDVQRYGDRLSSISLIVFCDYQNQDCRKQMKTANALAAEKNGKLRLIWRDLPLPDKDSSLMEAAILSRCAAYQNKFWETNDALLQTKDLSESSFQQIIKTIGLNTNALNTCRNDLSVRTNITEEVKAARHDGVNSVPLIFVGTRAFSGLTDESIIREEIDLQLAM